MIFKQIDQVLSGEKTQTRRVMSEGDLARHDCEGVFEIHKQGKNGLRVAYEVGKTYPIIPKRGQKAIVGKRIKVTALRIERLQDITEADAITEGCVPKSATRRDGFTGELVEVYASARGVYCELWESINTRKGTRWGDNPLVAVITFEVVNS